MKLMSNIKILFSRLRSGIRSRPGLFVLILILAIISLGTIKPSFYLLGWDNFSSYLSPSNNIFNTLFATWREHRGLGVPSDAESNDIMRQLFSAVLSPLVGLKVIDQLYFVLILWAGTLTMYGLGRKLGAMLKYSLPLVELFGFFASFFYLFNLSTLSVFYFPMIMYVTRYFSLPMIVLTILTYLGNPPQRMRTHALYLLGNVVALGAFMVPTIFIVLMMMLGLLIFFVREKRKVIIVLTVFTLLNSYWIFPFVNYTIQKGKIVPEAPTFIEINEAMLNKTKQYYAFENQAKVRPSFFESSFNNNETASVIPFHPLASHDQEGWYRIALWIFPITYFLGIFWVFLFQRKRILLWFAVSTLLFLLLSMKEYSPVGILYGLMLEHIPFASTIFRFGDTKFHAMVAFSGSIMTAILLTQITSSLHTVLNRFSRPLITKVVQMGLISAILKT